MQSEPQRNTPPGCLCAQQEQGQVTGFRTQKARASLACVAFHLNTASPRERLIEILRPGRDLDAGCIGLHTALVSLRRQFKSPGTPASSVLLANLGKVLHQTVSHPKTTSQKESATPILRKLSSFSQRIEARLSMDKAGGVRRKFNGWCLATCLKDALIA